MTVTVESSGSPPSSSDGLPLPSYTHLVSPLISPVHTAASHHTVNPAYTHKRFTHFLCLIFCYVTLQRSPAWLLDADLACARFYHSACLLVIISAIRPRARFQPPVSWFLFASFWLIPWLFCLSCLLPIGFCLPVLSSLWYRIPACLDQAVRHCGFVCLPALDKTFKLSPLLLILLCCDWFIRQPLQQQRCEPHNLELVRLQIWWSPQEMLTFIYCKMATFRIDSFMLHD